MTHSTHSPSDTATPVAGGRVAFDWDLHDREMQQISETIDRLREARLQREWRDMARGARGRDGLVLENPNARTSKRRAHLTLVTDQSHGAGADPSPGPATATDRARTTDHALDSLRADLDAAEMTGTLTDEKMRTL